MSAEGKTKLRLEIGHFLFLDIVGYSKLSTDEQHARLGELKQIGIGPTTGSFSIDPRFQNLYQVHRSNHGRRS